LPDGLDGTALRASRRREIEFGEGAGDGRLAAGELEALAPVLPGLVAELLSISSLHDYPGA
jgi:hypothetical protein